MHAKAIRCGVCTNSRLIFIPQSDSLLFEWYNEISHLSLNFENHCHVKFPQSLDICHRMKPVAGRQLHDSWRCKIELPCRVSCFLSNRTGDSFLSGVTLCICFLTVTSLSYKFWIFQWYKGVWVSLREIIDTLLSLKVDILLEYLVFTTQF